MKKRNQAPDKKSTISKNMAQPKARTGLVEIEVLLPNPLRRAVERCARKLRISPSRFFELAIRKQLPRIETATGELQRVSRDLMISERRAD
jgi:hypothetical protein